MVYSHQQIESIGVTEDEIMEYFEASTSPLSPVAEMDMGSSIQYVSDLRRAELLEEGKSIIGRSKEIRLILETLERSERQGILLVGAPGVGKTGIIRALAHEMEINQDEIINQTSLVGLNTSKILAQSGNETEITQKLRVVVYLLLTTCSCYSKVVTQRQPPIYSTTLMHKFAMVQSHY